MAGKKLPLEQAYFHINNGGITLKIVEIHNERKSNIYPPREGEGVKTIGEKPPEPIGVEVLHNRRWVFEVRTNHFGAGVTFRFPLGNPVMVGWLVKALQRVLARMLDDPGKPTDGFEYAFRDCAPANVTRQDGEQVDLYWPKDPPPYQEKSDSG